MVQQLARWSYELTLSRINKRSLALTVMTSPAGSSLFGGAMLSCGRDRGEDTSGFVIALSRRQ